MATITLEVPEEIARRFAAVRADSPGVAAAVRDALDAWDRRRVREALARADRLGERVEAHYRENGIGEAELDALQREIEQDD